MSAVYTTVKLSGLYKREKAFLWSCILGQYSIIPVACMEQLLRNGHELHYARATIKYSSLMYYSRCGVFPFVMRPWWSREVFWIYQRGGHVIFLNNLLIL
jgi:hypothetical protein